MPISYGVPSMGVAWAVFGVVDLEAGGAMRSSERVKHLGCDLCGGDAAGNAVDMHSLVVGANTGWRLIV